VTKNGGTTIQETRYLKNKNQTTWTGCSPPANNNQSNKVEIRLSDMHDRDQRGEKLTRKSGRPLVLSMAE
jgi:hypothetical protein